MKAILHAGNSEHQQRTMTGLAASLKRDGWQVTVTAPGGYQPADLVVFWGHRQRAIIAAQRERGLPYLVAERAYIGDRFHYTSLGYNGLNGRAQFDNAHCTDPARFDQHFPGALKPMQPAGRTALVIGQVPNDAALVDVPGMNLDAWVRQMQAQIPKLMGLPVRYRAHPQVAPSLTTLEEDLADAAVCVTWNSNSGVIAALAGVPVIAMGPGSMAAPVASDHLSLFYPDEQARRDWAARLAWCQWTPAEIADGTAWAHLRRRFQTATAEAAA